MTAIHVASVRYVPLITALKTETQTLLWLCRLHCPVLLHTSVGIATGYGLNGCGSNAGRGKRFFCTPHSPNQLWGPPSFLSNYTAGFFLAGKAAVTWSWPLSTTKYRDQKWWSYTSTLQYVFIAWCLIKARTTLRFIRKNNRMWWLGLSRCVI
jgi:hypothetical protein